MVSFGAARGFVLLCLVSVVSVRVTVDIDDVDTIGTIDTIDDVVTTAEQVDFQKTDGCGEPYSGTLVVGCERVAGLRNAGKTNPLCQVRLIEYAPGAKRNQQLLTSAAMTTRTVAKSSEPKWMEAFTTDVQCLEKDDLPTFMIEIEVLSQGMRRNVSHGLVRIPFDQVMSGALAGQISVMLRKDAADADYWGPANESRRFQFKSSLAEFVSDARFSDGETTTTTTTTLKLRSMPNLGELTLRLTWCQTGYYSDCVRDAIVLTQGERNPDPTQTDQYKCNQGCEEDLVPALLSKVNAVIAAFEQVTKDGRYCLKEEDYAGRCGVVNGKHVSCGVSRCCSPAGWCGASATHCPGRSDYSRNKCKLHLQNSKSWRKASELLQELSGSLVEDARTHCGNLASKPVGVAMSPIKDILDLTLHPEDYSELWQQLNAVKDGIRAMGSTFDRRWWTARELVPSKLKVTDSCFKNKWG